MNQRHYVVDFILFISSREQLSAQKYGILVFIISIIWSIIGEDWPNFYADNFSRDKLKNNILHIVSDSKLLGNF